MVGPALASLSLLILAPAALLLLLLYFIIRPHPVRVPIKNRHVFITGGSSGIGLALAHAAAAEGASRVSILARSPEKLEEARSSIQLATGVDVAAYAADVRDYAAVAKAVADAGPIDVLVVNQGVFVPQELEKQEMDEVRFMIDINLVGSFHVIKAALPGMKNRDRSKRSPASIALMSSQAGQVGIYGYTAYSATKFGLRGLAEALQQEVIADDIHVSLIFPPDTETPGLAEENTRRPELTSIIAGSSGVMKADEVAKKAFGGIKSGSFIIPCNFEGTLLAIATAVELVFQHREVARPKEGLVILASGSVGVLHVINILSVGSCLQEHIEEIAEYFGRDPAFSVSLLAAGFSVVAACFHILSTPHFVILELPDNIASSD